jgi:tetratricopeptide (TPR) repeat protein
MIWQNTKLLLRLFYRPVGAMSGIIDEGHWLFAAAAVVALSVLMQFAVTSHIHDGYEAVYRPLDTEQAQQAEYAKRQAAQSKRDFSLHTANAGQNEMTGAEYDDPEIPDFVIDRLPLPVVGEYGWWFVSFTPNSIFTTLLGIAVLYVPGLILLTAMSGSAGSFSVVFRRDYGPLLTCALMAWAAAHLPFALAGLALSSLAPSLGLPAGGARAGLVLWSLSALYFGFLMAFGIRTLFGAGFRKGLAVVAVAAFAFSIQAKLFATVSPYLFSPFLLYYAYSMFRGDIGDIGFSLRQRQSFRRSMEAATINPRDASAHYQLGLVFQYRRQYAEAISRFQQAIQIDKDETDAHFQLGRIAREQGRLQDAIDHFTTVLDQDDRHAHNEVWREVGVTYLNASMFAEAREALEKFVERRGYDPEGLYYYGKTLEHLGEKQQAHTVFARCIDAVKTMPHYRHGDQGKWQKLARERLSGRRRATA